MGEGLEWEVGIGASDNKGGGLGSGIISGGVTANDMV